MDKIQSDKKTYTLPLFSDRLYESRRELMYNAESVYTNLVLVTTVFMNDDEILAIFDKWAKTKEHLWWLENKNKTCYWWWKEAAREANSSKIEAALDTVPVEMQNLRPALYMSIRENLDLL